MTSVKPLPTERRTVGLISGIGPNTTGTGRLISYIVENSLSFGVDLKFVHAQVTWMEVFYAWRGGAKKAALRILARYFRDLARMIRKILPVLLDRNIELIVFHPQNLGMFLAMFVLRFKRGPSALFLLDSSFFCQASYNHIANENQACLRCLAGNFKQARIQGCESFPNLNWFNVGYLKFLRRFAKNRNFRLIAQNAKQADLARRHFGDHARIDIAGIWTSEFDAILAKQSASDTVKAPAPDASKSSIIFHGHDLPAKGADWVLSVARQSPELQFLVPFTRPQRWSSVPENIEFSPMTWESGLADRLKASAGILVPSLWSACIEGALVKSIQLGPPVFVVDNPTAFASEILDPVVHVLAADPKRAADEMVRLNSKSIDREPERRRWLESFGKMREQFWSVLARRDVE